LVVRCLQLFQERRLEWDKAGVFESLWKSGLVEKAMAASGVSIVAGLALFGRGLPHHRFNRFRKLLVRYAKFKRGFVAFNHIAAAVIAIRKVPLKIKTNLRMAS
jgi:hypothetical protein